jgi:NADPH:quinone reductase-like Zn-dependent oxidoreductase
MTRTARQADELAYRESDGISVSLRWNRERATPAGVGREVGAVFDGAGGENATEALGLLRSGGRYFSYGNSSFEGQGPVEIYTVRPDGTGVRRVRRERRSYSFEPVWSPDGTRIAMVHGTFGTVPKIWTMRSDGGDLRQITRGPRLDLRPHWGTRSE